MTYIFILGLETAVETVQQPKAQEKGVQVLVKCKYFRSKFTQTDIKSHDFATSPSKIWATTVATSPFKVEENVNLGRSSVPNVKRILIDISDSDMSQYTPTSSFEPSSPSVTSLQTFTSDSSSLNEEEVKIEKEKEARKAVNTLCKKISAKPRLYIGITNDCYFLIDLLHKNTCIPTEHILLCLKKIRLNSTFSELADQFEICTSHAGKIFAKNIPMIANILKSFIVPLKIENIKRCLPIAFRHRFNKVSCIIDCFEIEIEKPSKSVHQALTWSEYKKGNTIKYLISSTPNGLVNYVSPGYGGRISDTLLVENCKFLEELKPGSWVLADRGFKHIEQVLNQRKCHLLRPPSIVQGAKLTKEEAHKTKQIASLRIHIERVIRRIREFSMLKPHSVLNSKLIRMLDDCVIIACALINLQDSIIQ